MEKFGLHTRQPLCFSIAVFARPICSSHPVVPTTIGTPSAAMPSMFAGTTPGMENSIATSIPAKLTAVSPSPFALLNSSSFSATANSYSGASCSMSFPILPYPTMASLRMHRFLTLEHVGVQCGKELLVQRANRARQVGLGHHDADVEQARALADHANIDAVQRVEHAARHAGRVANVLADQTHDHAIVLHRRFRKLAK